MCFLVRDKKDLPLDAVDQKDQDGSFDYRYVNFIIMFYHDS